METAAKVCLLCGSQTISKNRRIVDLTLSSMFSRSLRWLYNVKLAEKGKNLVTPDEVFSTEAHFCRKCHNAFESYVQKSCTFLSGINDVLNNFELSDPELEINSLMNPAVTVTPHQDSTDEVLQSPVSSMSLTSRKQQHKESDVEVLKHLMIY
jgi:hypothetical protein